MNDLFFCTEHVCQRDSVLIFRWVNTAAMDLGDEGCKETQTAMAFTRTRATGFFRNHYLVLPVPWFSIYSLLI